MESALALVSARPGNHNKAPADLVFTTGQVARLCCVAPRTVSKWFDSGRLKGFRLPGSSDRRFYGDSLVAFMREHGFRVPAELEPPPPVVVVYGLSDCPIPSEFRVARDQLEYGALVASERVGAAVLGDDDGLSAALSAARLVRSRRPEARIVFALSPDLSPQAIADAGFADCEVLARPEAREKLPLLLAG